MAESGATGMKPLDIWSLGSGLLAGPGYPVRLSSLLNTMGTWASNCPLLPG